MSLSLLVLLVIALLILAAKICGAISGRLGFPIVLGELLAGVLLGPSVLNSARWFHSSSQGHSLLLLLQILGEVGVVLLMFVAGLETDLPTMRSAIAPAFWAAIGGVILPLTAGAVVTRAAGFTWLQAILVGTILTATSVTITAQTLMNLGQLRSRPGSTILAAAVIDDVLGLIVLSIVIALAPRVTDPGPVHWTVLGFTLGRMVLCLVLLTWFGPYLTRWVFGRASKMHGSHLEIAAALFVAFLAAVQAEWLGGMAAITGAYLAGLFVAGTSSHEMVSREIQPMINSFFAPLFFVSIGLGLDIWQVKGGLGFFIGLLGVAVLGKVVGCGAGARIAGFRNRDSLIVGVGMIPRGEVGLITAALGYASGWITENIYTQVVSVVVLSTLVTPGLLRFALPQAEVSTDKLQALEQVSLVSVAGQNG